jgi:peroxiredoxin
MVVLLALACKEPLYYYADDPPPVDETGETGETGDTGAHTGPGEWTDPLQLVSMVDVNTAGMELTDALVVGDTLVLAGQHQRGQGALWTFDISEDPTAPVFQGHLNARNVQSICWDGTYLWGVDRESTLMRFDLTETGPKENRSRGIGGNDGGIGCSADYVGYGRGINGATVFSNDGSDRTVRTFDHQVTDLAFRGDTVFVLSPSELQAWDLVTKESLGSVELSGHCRDVELDDDGLVVACGSTGVVLIDPDSLAITGGWQGTISVRGVALGPDRIVASGWTDVVALDRQATWQGSEPGKSAALEAAVGPEGLIYVADWNLPFILEAVEGPSPEVRLSPNFAQAGAVILVHNDGDAPLWVDRASDGTLSGQSVPPGGLIQWTLPEDLAGDAEPVLFTDDPDEPEPRLESGQRGGLRIGAPAPAFSEFDTLDQLWTLEDLAGQVVWLGLFEDGCPVCSSEVGATEAFFVDRIGSPEGYVRLWAYTGGVSEDRPVEWSQEAGILGTVLYDQDSTLRQSYWVENGEDTFARNPRHFIIDADGNIAYTATNMNLEDEAVVLEGLLGL